MQNIGSLISGPWTRAARGANLLDDAGQAVPTVFARMSALAARTGALNLGQGFPDTDPPTAVAEAAITAIREGHNQYPPGLGTPELREAIAVHQRHWYGLDWDPQTEVLVTAGATEALAATLLAFISPGDEVLTLEPFYDAYAAVIALAGGVHRTVPLQFDTDADGDLRIGVDPAALRAAITDRTRVILVNSPHNPTGLMLSDEALTAIVTAAQEHDALIVTDEVYEHLTYSRPHRPVASLPGAAERTVSISSAGKTLSVTGWKIGWVCARPELITAVLAVKQWLTYVSGGPFQPAVATGLQLPDEVFAGIAQDLREKRDLLLAGLRAAGLRVAVPEAGYFVVADAAPLGVRDAEQLCEELPQRAGVVAIPLSAFCSPATAPDAASMLRFAFCKDRAILEEAARRLAAWGRAGG